MKRLATAPALVLGLLLMACPALAGEFGGVTMDDTMETDSATLVLNGMAQRSVLWIDVYVAGLYLPEKTNVGEAALTMTGPKKMVMAFQRDVGSEDICDSWKEGFEKNVSGGGLAFVKPLEQLCKDTPEETLDGQTVAYTYYASTDETVYEIDGVVVGAYSGAEFFNALLACWVGPEPGPGTSFKEDLLGQD